MILNKEGNVYKISGYKSPKIKLENESIIKAFWVFGYTAQKQAIEYQ